MNIDGSVLRELKRRQRREGKPLGELMSELLATALEHAGASADQDEAFEWTTSPMRARVDLDDKEALRRALDAP